MLIKTILNRIQKLKSFVYDKVRVEEKPSLAILVHIAARANARPVCSRCRRQCPGYDTLTPRRFEFVPLWGIPVFFVYAMRRVHCPTCGVVVEAVPWAQGKSHLTRTYAWFLAKWAKRLAWKEVADAFMTSWDNVFRSVKMAVAFGLANRSLEGITAIGVDEVAWKKGHHYLTLVYQINTGAKRLLWVGKDRTEATFTKFFDMLGEARSQLIDFVCSDMWKPYLKVIAKKTGQALNILDRFHVMALFSKALDEVRAKEARDLKEKGLLPVLKHSRWVFLKRPEHLTDTQETKLADLLRYNLKSVRSYLLKEEFQRFWEYRSPYWALRFLSKWCVKAMRSRIEPMKKVAKTLRAHKELIGNWFSARDVISLGVVEGLNTKVKVTTRKSYGFRTFQGVQIALYHALGDLPEPKTTHRFC